MAQIVSGDTSIVVVALKTFIPALPLQTAVLINANGTMRR
jgi:hypothetical protein